MRILFAELFLIGAPNDEPVDPIIFSGEPTLKEDCPDWNMNCESLCIGMIILFMHKADP